MLPGTTIEVSRTGEGAYTLTGPYAVATVNTTTEQFASDDYMGFTNTTLTPSATSSTATSPPPSRLPQLMEAQPPSGTCSTAAASQASPHSAAFTYITVRRS